MNSPDPASSLLRGWGNVPLSSAGIEQAQHIGQMLRAQDIRPDTFSESDLSRARQTGHIIGQYVGMQPMLDPMLRTLNVGRLEGLPKDAEMLATLRHYVTNPNDRIPGGETVNEALSRFVPTVKQHVMDPRINLVVSHGWGASVLEGLWSPEGGVGGKIDQKAMLREPKLKPGKVLVILPNWEHYELDGEDMAKQGVDTPAGAVAAYAPPSAGPFECEHCRFFDRETDDCSKPEVIKELGANKRGMASVESHGCCNFFKKHGAKGAEADSTRAILVGRLHDLMANRGRK